VSARARRDLELEPFDLCVRGPNGGRHWAQVLIIAIQDPGRDRPWLVHCAIPRDESHRIEQYLSKVATRTGRPRPGCPARPQQELTRRENEVLQLLAEDHSLYAIADELCISYVTVRNHVQHILAKLGVHSIIEAVARHLRHQKNTGT
jgi:DNA-binding CsgD family transcriptional regulator